MLPAAYRFRQSGITRESPYDAAMTGNDTSATWRFFTRGPGLFYTWPFLPLFKYFPILFGSTPPPTQPRPQREMPGKAQKTRSMLRLARAWKLLRLTTKLRIPFRAMLAAYRQQNSREQYKAHLRKRPTSVEGMEKYLASGMMHGFGPIYAKRLIKALGNKVFDVIQSTPERLREVDGIGPRRAERIVAAWAEQKIVREIMVFLHSHGVALNCRPWVRSVCQVPLAVTHSPAEIDTTWPMTVTKSLWPRALTLSTRRQEPRVVHRSQA